MQTTSQLLMIRPVSFGFNAETAVNNAFQVAGKEDNAQQQALQEFESMAALLQSKDISVTVISDTPVPYTPDSIFPNNWISFHHDHTICLYPMFAPNRRLERNPALIKQIQQQFNIQQVIDFSDYESKSLFLEGTGSMVLDRDNRIAYACLSDRTHIEVLDAFCRRMNYIPVAFRATDKADNPIYHTNVMMCIAEQYAVICLESIKAVSQRKNIIHAISGSGKEIIRISHEQMNQFAGNMLQVKNTEGERFLVMSTRACQSLSAYQIKKLKKYNTIIHAPLNTIENNGGGSARCMIAEVFV
ncbi:MAG: amidinotransferase [Chitinophagaceae bacterium]|nr:amidinotransferase [Chitinophagaceae bacterium]